MASRSGESLVTRDHEQIRSWVEARGGQPSVVKSTHDKGQGAGLLRIDFPGYSGKDSLEKISWEEFFSTFDRKNLGFLYQETTRDGQQSRFFKFVGADQLEAVGEDDEEEEDEEEFEDEYEDEEEEEELEDDALDEEEEDD